MLALVPPALLLGLLLSVAYASLLHLWKGRSLRDLLLYLLASACGFAVGQLLGLLLQMPLPRIGQVHVVEATVFAWVALIGVRELTTMRRANP
jgi:uncharacterized membrane protein YfcA